MPSPLKKLKDQFIADFDKLADLVQRRRLGEKGLDKEIELLKQSMNIKEALISGEKKRDDNNS